MRLISFLGTGQYGTTQYTFNAQHCETCYVAAAMAHFIKPTEIIILATKEAEEKHGKGLRAEIERLQLAELEFQNIPYGGNTEELWQQFEIISKVITKEAPEAVTLDITHGFRAQPFFAASVIAYLRAIDRKPSDFRVHYGEFRQDELKSPIWDLSVFITLLDWSSALHSFIKTGHSKALVALAIDENTRIHKAGGENRPKKLKSLADSLNDFSANMATVRCPQLITGKERGSARAVLKLIAESDAEVKTYFKPLVPVLELLRQQLDQIPAESLFGDSGHQALSALSKLYLKYERYPEALITLREGWISLYAEAGKTDQELLESKKRCNTEDRWREAENTDDKKNADDISNVRNDIEHGGFRAQPCPARTLREQTEKLVAAFEVAQPQPTGKTYFISRHPGAFAWANTQGFQVDECLEHFDVNLIQDGDTVIGTLPVNLIAQVNERGGRYFHLALELPAERRGQELSAEEMQKFGAQLKEFKVISVSNS
ncbi:MAG: CRISPR-associated protein Csx16 [Pseudomonadota bacterium]|nr:CRISPR-associated protein Csx16 [Pseudomonadota bacterium]